MPPKRHSRTPPFLSRRINSEKIVTRNLLNGFVSKGSRGENLIEEMISLPIKKISLTGLIQIANIVSNLINVKLERNYKRKKALIIKWFQENEELIIPIKNCLKIVYEVEDNKNDQKNNDEEEDKTDEIDILNINHQFLDY